MRWPAELVASARAAAAREGLTLSAWLRRIVTIALRVVD
jgi:hypothetical protein